MNTYYVYIITNKWHTVLYVGMTNDLRRRTYEHREKLVAGFSGRYNLNKLVYCEETDDVNAAIAREKQIKKWGKTKKVKLIKQMNPEWKDLSDGWF